jgi:dipeptidyl aminopeptidase/acylaminoacyl peptidase
MADKKQAPYGSWKSPVTSDSIVAGTIGLNEIQVDGRDVYWIESRPSENGRNVIVRQSESGTTADVIPAGFNARTTVHEYGGGSYVVDRGLVYFSNFADQRIYIQRPGQDPRPLTLTQELRYADGVIDRRRGRMIAIREDHRSGGRDCINTIVSLKLEPAPSDENSGDVLVSGADFYSSPRLSPDGRRLAWLSWNHPNLPWDGTELWVADLDETGGIADRTLVAGGPTESVFQPEWSPDDVLHFASDRTGWWNLYRWREGQADALTRMEAEFGLPQWLFRMSVYAFESSRRIVCAYNVLGSWNLATLDTETSHLLPIATPYTEISSIAAREGEAFFCAGSPANSMSVVRLDLATGETKVLRKSSSIEFDSSYISIPRTIEYPTVGGRTAYGFFYPPVNGDFEAPAGERPPLLVISHGGPTAATTTTLRMSVQYWTSRGFGVLDVNYGGSTGYGRSYRERLNGNWGVVDVDDCAMGATYLVAQGDADDDRLIIRGGSAGGYTTLAALTFRDAFKAGASYYGICDLEVLERDCHKFESQYNRSLIGPYPQRKDLYVARSPIHFTGNLSCPMILFQGLEDKVVPPNQAEMMFDAVKKKGLPVAYVAFAGEQHGFRKAENIKRSLDGELYFYSRVFGFELAEPVEPVTIENIR